MPFYDLHFLRKFYDHTFPKENFEKFLKILKIFSIKQGVLASWRVGDLERWRVESGDLETWRVGELERWRDGEMESGELARWRVDSGELATWRVGELAIQSGL